MINFKKPHLVPQSTQSLARGAEGERQSQAKAYNANKANNHRQMDDIRHAQYHKQASAVNKQKTRMQSNAAKSSKDITGSSAYYKEQMTFEEFLALQEAEQRLIAPKRRNPMGSGTLTKAGSRRTRTAIKRKLDPDRGRYDQAGGNIETAGQTDSSRIRGGTREAGPNSGNRVPEHRSIVKVDTTAKRDKGERISTPKKGTYKGMMKSAAAASPKATKAEKAERAQEPPKKEKKAKAQKEPKATSTAGSSGPTSADERAQRMQHKDEKRAEQRADREDRLKRQKAKDKEKAKEKRRAGRKAFAQGVGKFRERLAKTGTGDNANNDVSAPSVYKGSTMTYGGSK